ncbi:hypothetical protein RBB50_010330 [Rhinocladiella similis]
MSRGSFRYRPHYADPNQPPYSDFRHYEPGNEQARPVDSWRSYRNDTENLQTSSHQWMQPRVPSDYMPHNHSQNMRSTSSANYLSRYDNNGAADTREPLRLQSSTQGRGTVQQRQEILPLATSHHYTFRSRQPQQAAAYSTSSQDVPLPSIETPDVFIPQSRVTNLPIRQVRSGRSGSTIPREIEPVPVPKPTSEYKKKAALPPALRQHAQKLLVILDLNGTLLVRPNRRGDPTKFKIRPGVTQLLDYLFTNHVVMVYSSARPENTTAMVNNLIHPVQRQQMAAVWARDKLGLTRQQYNNKVQVYKKLDKIWSDGAIQRKAEKGCKWDQGNTVLVDDSHLKGLAEPNNLLQVPEFENNAPKEGGADLRDWQLKEQTILQSLELKLEVLKYQVDVSRLIRQWQTGQIQAPGVVDETIDQKTQRRIEQPEATPGPSVAASPAPSASSVGYGIGGSMPTPSSLSRTVTLASEGGDDHHNGVFVGGGDHNNLLDVLEREIDRQLDTSQSQKTASASAEKGASSTGTNVRKDAPMTAKKKKAKGKGKRKELDNSLEHVPRTPESLRS